RGRLLRVTMRKRCRRSRLPVFRPRLPAPVFTVRIPVFLRTLAGLIPAVLPGKILSANKTGEGVLDECLGEPFEDGCAGAETEAGRTCPGEGCGKSAEAG